MSKVPREQLSTSEYTILGLVWREGPCTTYAVMRELANSASTFYRNRAASTYRVVQRLIDFGLLEPIGEEIGSRGERLIKSTPEGERVLQQWLRPPIPRVEVAHTIDLVRLRVFFLGALKPEDQMRFLEDALEALSAEVKSQEELVKSTPDPYEVLGSIGLLYETKARVEWIKHITTKLPELQLAASQREVQALPAERRP